MDEDSEVTLSYCNLGLPVHLRADDLEPYGFTHEECEGCEETKRDARWMARHACEFGGRVQIMSESFSSDSWDARAENVIRAIC